jgi:carboxypeptidase Q
MPRCISRSALIAAIFCSIGQNLSAQQPPANEPTAKDVAKSAEQSTAPKKEEKEPVARIKEEGMEHSQVMKTLSYLTDVIGPRLTASPAMKRANEWTSDKLTEWGLENAHLEGWGPFGRGWTLKKFSAQVVEPQCIPLIAYPKAWSPGTDGPICGDVVYFDVKSESDLEKYKGKLKGAIVLMTPARTVNARFEPMATRLTDKELLALADASAPRPRGRRPSGPATKGANDQPSGRPQPGSEQRATMDLNRKKLDFLMEEGAALLLDASNAGDGGTLFVASASIPGAQPFGMGAGPRRAAWDKDAPKILPQVTVSKEHYNRMMRMIEQGQALKIAVDLQVEFHDVDLMGYNTVAEIPGTDLKDEIVMLGGHMDSWHSGTGATDNAAGVAVAMEAVRILQALDLKPRRTIRIGLWSGEEEGLFGSRAYVKEHFGQIGDGTPAATFAAMRGDSEAAKLQTKGEYDKFSAYFNLDNGTGKVRGVYLQGNEAVRPIFREWLAPFRDMGASTLTIANTGGTDHESFDAIGLPGFQFIQDVIEYNTRTHHSNQDLYDRIQADDMKQSAVIMAAFVYNTAMRDEKLPRKPSPAPAPAPTTASASAAK